LRLACEREIGPGRRWQASFMPVGATEALGQLVRKTSLRRCDGCPGRGEVSRL